MFSWFSASYDFYFGWKLLLYEFSLSQQKISSIWNIERTVFNFSDPGKESSIKYVRKIFRKTNISNPWYAHLRVRIRGLEMLVFRKI